VNKQHPSPAKQTVLSLTALLATTCTAPRPQRRRRRPPASGAASLRVGRLGAAQCCPALVQAADLEKERQAAAAGRAGGIRGESRSSGRRRTGAGGGRGVRRGMEARDGSQCFPYRSVTAGYRRFLPIPLLGGNPYRR
jgi:hypothetical protein